MKLFVTIVIPNFNLNNLCSNSTEVFVLLLIASVVIPSGPAVFRSFRSFTAFLISSLDGISRLALFQQT